MSRLTAKQAEIFKALGHPTRVTIVKMLLAGERCVCEIQPAVQAEQPTLSKHLAVLRRAGIVACRRDGLRVIYRLASDKIPELIRISGSVVEDGVRDSAALWTEIRDA